MKQKSIFINASEEMKSLNELTYNNLKTLVDIEEGYFVTFFIEKQRFVYCVYIVCIL